MVTDSCHESYASLKPAIGGCAAEKGGGIGPRVTEGLGEDVGADDTRVDNRTDSRADNFAENGTNSRADTRMDTCADTHTDTSTRCKGQAVGGGGAQGNVGSVVDDMGFVTGDHSNARTVLNVLPLCGDSTVGD